MMKPCTWATIDELVGAALDQTLTRAQLREFVTAQWNAKRFAFRCERLPTWAPKIAALAEQAGVTHHGRPDQPVCPSWHLFGDAASVAARLVFDPPNSPQQPEPIEFHTHPVDSVILVVRGGGSYRMCHRDAAGRDVVVDVPLEAGSVVCFPGDVVHTIECGAEGIETLNITDRLNQPAWRDDPTLRNSGPVASADFARAADPPAGAPLVAYAGFATAPTPDLL
jgi:hypothetical protein